MEDFIFEKNICEKQLHTNNWYYIFYLFIYNIYIINIIYFIFYTIIILEIWKEYIRHKKWR